MSKNVSSDLMDSFQNNDEKSLQKLTYRIKNCGIVQDVPALSKYWVEKRYYLRYEIPKIENEDGKTIIGAKEEWLELVNHIIEDLKWLLSLPHFKFWSNVVFEPSMLGMLSSVLQESPPFYALDDFPDQTDMRDALNTVQHLVLLTFLRLVTTKETPRDYQDPNSHGNILYDNYIFTVAVIWDLCQLYGRDNGNTVEIIIKNLFNLKPAYEEDLKKSLPFLSRVFRGIEQRFEDCPVYMLGETVPLSERGGGNGEITLNVLEDHVLHILDVSSTLAIFLDIYPDGGKIFNDTELMNRITSIYENTLPKMYEKLEKLAYNNETMDKYFQIVHRLDVARVDLLKLYRSIIFSSINNILENKNRITEIEVKESVDRYLGLLLDALSVKEFINDYHRAYPIDMDLDILAHVCPEVDSMKCDFILQSLYASLNDSSKITRRNVENYQSSQSHGLTLENNHNFENIPGPSSSSSGTRNDLEIEDGFSNVKTGVELASLITEVKDILPHLGEGYIEKCLKHYNNDSTSVINAVLEDSLPPDIKELDPTLPHIPPDPMEASVAVDVATGMERLNVFDNDEFDVMTRDNIDTSKIHKGKRKGKHKNLNELLNDKSYKEGLSSVYSKYSLIADDYEDEYDDTYESQDVGLSAREELTEVDARPFTVPRVLQTQAKYKAASEDDDVDEDYENYDSTAQTSAPNNERMQFAQDPAVLRARAEQRRQLKRDQTRKSVPTQEKDVTGKPKGQGQEKQVVVNRDNKNTHKSSRANHNRRRGAQWKRTQGMVPS